MELSTLFQLPTGMRVRKVTVASTALTVEATARHGPAPCPSCQTPSKQVHSYYTRTVADLPCGGRHVMPRLQARKLRCTNTRCSQRVFTERFPAYLQPWARTTVRVAQLIAALGLLVGGRGAERLGRLLGVPVSDPTVLRIVMRQDPAPSGTERSAVLASEVRMLGVDDCAFRRASRSGALLMDLEQRRVIDLLPDRLQPTCAQWLQNHPEIHLISRDRGGDDAAAARVVRHRPNRLLTAFICW